MTPRGAYIDTPHKTIEELCTIASQRAQSGEPASSIIQDLVDGYSFGWLSANHDAIARATRRTA